MAISIRGTPTAWVAANATTQTVTLPAHVAGDMLLVRVTYKHVTLPATMTCGTSGWTKLGQYANGTTASANGTGTVTIGVFYKEATSAAETSPVITFHGTTAATPSGATAIVYQKGATEAWLTPVGDGGALANSTGMNGTIQSHVSATAGDLIDFFVSAGDNNAITVPTFTQAGLSLGTVAVSPATALNDSTSNDISASGGYRAVSSGTSSAAAAITSVIGTAEVGAGAWTTRLRVQAITTVAGSFTADAYIAKQTSGTVTADTYVKRTFSGQTWASTYIADAFNRTNGAGWGNADTGGTWETIGADSLATAEVLSNKGHIVLDSEGGSLTRGIITGVPADVEITGKVDYSMPSGAGQNVTPGVSFRGGQIHTEMRVYTDGTATLSVTGPGITFPGGITLTGINASAGTLYFHVKAIGTAISVAWWKEGDSEQAPWTYTTTYTTAGYAGFLGWFDSGDTGPFTLDFDDLLVTSERSNTQFTAAAQIKRTFAGTLTADAQIEATFTTYGGSATAAAWLGGTLSGSITADSIISVTAVSGSFTADAYIKRTWWFGSVEAGF